MNPTSLAILQTVAASDSTLSQGQRATLHDLIAGRSISASSSPSGPLLLTPKETARMLSVSRVTLWRMTRDGIFHAVEILPGTPRYRRDEIESFVRRMQQPAG